MKKEGEILEFVKEQEPNTCFHSHLESIEKYVYNAPSHGDFIPVFVCTKCGTVLFVLKDKIDGKFVVIDECVK